MVSTLMKQNFAPWSSSCRLASPFSSLGEEFSAAYPIMSNGLCLSFSTFACVFSVNLYCRVFLFVCSWRLMYSTIPDNRKPCSNSCWLDPRNQQRMGGCCCSTRKSHVNGTPAYYYVRSLAFPHDHDQLLHLFSLRILGSKIFIPFCSARWLWRSVNHPKFIVARPPCSSMQDMIWTWIRRYQTHTEPLPHLSHMMWFWDVHNRKILTLLKKQFVDVVSELPQQWKLLGN